MKRTAPNSSPCVVVLHEVWGPDSHIEGICKRLGKLGFTAVVPNLYSGHESLLTQSNIQKAMTAVWNLSLEERRDKEKVAAELAKKHAGEVEGVLALLYDYSFRKNMLKITTEAIAKGRAECGKVATLGFSLGGGLSLAAATGPDPPDSAVAYCGEPPKPQDFSGSSVPMLTIYASHDEIINSKVPAFMDAALKHGSDLTTKTFPNTRHDFFNETKDSYNSSAAEEAWEITAWFLKRTLRKGPIGYHGQRNNRGLRQAPVGPGWQSG